MWLYYTEIIPNIDILYLIKSIRTGLYLCFCHFILLLKIFIIEFTRPAYDNVKDNVQNIPGQTHVGGTSAFLVIQFRLDGFWQKLDNQAMLTRISEFWFSWDERQSLVL